MEQLNLNVILDRENIKNDIISFLNNFELNKKKLNIKRGIYLYGEPGVGKTYFVKKILKDLGYDIIYYDAGDVRNKSKINDIAKHNMNDTNVLSMFKKKRKKLVIVMDEIDGMNNGDKGGINALIKIVRAKKTKKQKKEDYTMTPIISIGNYHVNKKIKELIKVCETFYLKKPTSAQINNILNIILPSIEVNMKENMIKYINGDLRKLISTYDIYKNQQSILKNKLIHTILKQTTMNENVKNITRLLLTNTYGIGDHFSLINETDRTSVGLLFHENVIDLISKNKNIKNNIDFYLKFLDNITYCDYIDRITFQKQIWGFNEISSLIKTFYNHYLLCDFKEKNKKTLQQPNFDEIRFTKVLTKYSTEYNNMCFIQKLCQILQMDKHSVLSYFIGMRDIKTEEEIYEIFKQEENIKLLDIRRIYSYIDNVLVY